MPADSKTFGLIKVSIVHPGGWKKIRRVKAECEAMGWGKNSQIFLYDDGKNSGDKQQRDGVFTGRLVVMKSIKPGTIRLPIIVEDIWDTVIRSEVVITVVGNLNGLY